VRFVREHADCNGRVGAVGFCFGGSIVNQLAVWLPYLQAAVPFYGSQPSAEETRRIQAPLLIHYASTDERINSGWPAYEAALTANDKNFTMHMYENTMHGFHNDTTPRYDEAAANLAWDRTIAFFNENLR
jgi:carboxymethylenebutenolidase